MPDFSLENECPHDFIIGIDEVGRGPWAGPVVAASVYIPKAIWLEPFITELNDSKKIPEKKRHLLFKEITSKCIYGIGIVSPEDIDRLNILQASLFAMEKSVDSLKITPGYALIDGNKAPSFNARDGLQTQTVIKGDSISNSIAAASIIAKVTRDQIMKELHTQYPHYGWDTNSGYGTKKHQEGLVSNGITNHHRKSFAPIKKLIPND